MLQQDNKKEEEEAHEMAHARLVNAFPNDSRFRLPFNINQIRGKQIKSLLPDPCSGKIVKRFRQEKLKIDIPWSAPLNAQ